MIVSVESLSANPIEEGGSSATKCHSQTKVNQENTVRRLQTDNKKLSVCYEPRAAAEWDRTQTEVVIVCYFALESVDNPQFVCKSKVVLLPYTRWHRPVDEEVLSTSASGTGIPFSVGETFSPKYFSIVNSIASHNPLIRWWRASCGVTSNKQQRTPLLSPWSTSYPWSGN